MTDAILAAIADLEAKHPAAKEAAEKASHNLAIIEQGIAALRKIVGEPVKESAPSGMGGKINTAASPPKKGNGAPRPTQAPASGALPAAQATILATLVEAGANGMTTAQIGAATGKDPRSAVIFTMRRLHGKGLVKRRGSGATSKWYAVQPSEARP